MEIKNKSDEDNLLGNVIWKQINHHRRLQPAINDIE